MIEPLLSDDALLTDIETAVKDRGSFHLWWLGQSGFLMAARGTVIAIDPYLSDTLTRKYASTSTPHERMTRRVVDPSRLTFVNGVTASHAHTDHLDPETLEGILKPRSSATLIYPAAITDLVEQRTARARPFLYAPVSRGIDSRAVRDTEVVMVPAAHPTLKCNAEGDPEYVGYVFRVKRGPTIYHSGDTVVYDGMVERLRPFNVDLAILPINGKVGNMGGRDAARLAHEIGAKLVIPCHYEMFEFNTADPREEFIPECERIGQPYKVLRAGERLTLAK